ncbi:hypothetical protein [Flavobacterium sp. TBRC 19031]|uniref:hypothetical protein n=1 Tax=Flavobacterium mekongense TaxID=3379707 RepID=UPI00399BDFA0
MKTKMIIGSVLSLLSITTAFAQNRTTVSAYNAEISDNLDLRAVASIFGDSRDLADFERRLNDPEIQISNLDLNDDNQVDYLRVIETVEGNAHLIVIQSVLGRDTYQDVATVEVERDRNNRVQVQVVGDVYMYGPNYIYEPVYAYTPVIYSTFWIGNYRPYCSSWYWGYYPSYYYAWSPWPVFRYRNHIGISINFHHHYNYVNYRRCGVVYNNYYRGGRRCNGYEVRYPNRSFQNRNSNYANRYELDQNRTIRTVGNRNTTANNPRNNYVDASPRGNGAVRNESPRTVRTQETTPRVAVRTEESPRVRSTVEASPRNNPRSYESPRGFNETKANPRTTTETYESPRPMNTPQAAPRSNPRSYETPARELASQSPRSVAPRGNSAPREMSAPRNNSGGQRDMSSQRSSSSRGNNGGRENRRG